MLTVCIYLIVSGQTSEKDEKLIDGHANEMKKEKLFEKDQPVNTTTETEGDMLDKKCFRYSSGIMLLINLIFHPGVAFVCWNII